MKRTLAAITTALVLSVSALGARTAHANALVTCTAPSGFSVQVQATDTAHIALFRSLGFRCTGSL